MCLHVYCLCCCSVNLSPNSYRSFVFSYLSMKTHTVLFNDHSILLYMLYIFNYSEIILIPYAWQKRLHVVFTLHHQYCDVDSINA